MESDHNYVRCICSECEGRKVVLNFQHQDYDKYTDSVAVNSKLCPVCEGKGYIETNLYVDC